LDSPDFVKEPRLLTEYLRRHAKLAKTKKLALDRIDDDAAFLIAWLRSIKAQKSEPITDQWNQLLQRPLPLQDLAFVALAASPWLQHDRDGRTLAGTHDFESAVARQNPTRTFFVSRALYLVQAARGIGSQGMELSNFCKNRQRCRGLVRNFVRSAEMLGIKGLEVTNTDDQEESAATPSDVAPGSSRQKRKLGEHHSTNAFVDVVWDIYEEISAELLYSSASPNVLKHAVVIRCRNRDPQTKVLYSGIDRGARGVHPGTPISVLLQALKACEQSRDPSSPKDAPLLGRLG